MKNILFIFSLLLIFFTSCANKQVLQNKMPVGEYYKRFDDNVIYSLSLKEDHTFIYTIKGGTFDNADSKCIGKWQLTKNELLLNCNKENLLNQISGGYMSTREFKVKFIDNKTLMLNEIYLKKK